MRIAICQQNDEQRAKLIQLIHQCTAFLPRIQPEIIEYNRPTLLWSAIMRGMRFDLLLLDVCHGPVWNLYSAVDYVAELHRLSKDMVMIFLVAPRKPFLPAAPQPVFWQIENPPMLQTLLSKMFLAQARHFQHNTFYSVKSPSATELIRADRIASFRYSGVKTRVCLDNGNYYEFREKRISEQDPLLSYGFLAVDKNILINLLYVTRAFPDAVVCLDERIPIAPAYRAAAQELFASLLRFVGGLPYNTFLE